MSRRTVGKVVPGSGVVAGNPVGVGVGDGGGVAGGVDLDHDIDTTL